LRGRHIGRHASLGNTLSHAIAKSLQEADVERGQWEATRLVEGKPSEFGTVIGLGLAGPSGNRVKENYNSGMPSLRRALRKSAGEEGVRIDTNSQLLVKLSNQRISRGFARLDLATGKFPETSMLLVDGPLLKEQLAFAVHNRARDH
jgi:hypothetical protein